MHHQHFTLTLTSDRERRSSDDVIRGQLVYIIKRTLTGNRGRGWKCTVQTIECLDIDPRKNSHGCKLRFQSSLQFHRTSEVEPARFRAQIDELTSWVIATGQTARFGSRPWQVAEEQPTRPASGTGGDLDSSGALLVGDNGLAGPDDLTSADDDLSTPLHETSPLDKGAFFDHLYNLDSQIEIVLSALRAAQDSNMANRFHVVLHGVPGCGKTEILQSTSRLLTSLGVNHQSLDATSTTEAGMRKNIIEEDMSPSVLLIEEIEKVPENSLRWLLGVMDIRGTIQVANFRRTATKKIECIVIASANDMELLKRMMYGALYSRFQHEVHCPRPGREVLAMILRREILKVNGSEEWIEPTLTFMYDDRKVTDPRKIIPVCLCGKDDLLTGVYQNHLRATMLQVQGDGRANSLQTTKSSPTASEILARLTKHADVSNASDQ